MNYLFVGYSIYKMARLYYGNFCWNSTGRKTEAYSIRDHQWCAYKYLTKLWCVITWENRLIYQQYGNYFKICLSDDLKLIYSPMYIHYLIHIDSVLREAKACDEVMVIAKDMTNCSGCLKQFQQINRNPYMKTHI